MEYRFCPICGSELIDIKELNRLFPGCPEGHYMNYPSQVVGVAGFVIKDDMVLLEKRAIEPGYGKWALPGGMIEAGEQPDSACEREIFEETGIEVSVKQLLEARSGFDICVLFYECIHLKGQLAKSEESLEVAWHPFDDIPWNDMAFPLQRNALEKYLCRYIVK